MLQRLIYIFLTLGLNLAQATVSLEALVQEQFVSYGDQGFGSQGGMIISRNLTDAGVSSITASIRLATPGENSNIVYLPKFRSGVNDLERFLIRSHHSRTMISFRPIMTINADASLSPRTRNINPKNFKTWAQNYFQSLYSYLALANRNNISEFVIATGMENLWNQDNSKVWINLAEKLKRRLPGTALAIEITSNRELEALELWSQEDPSSFNKFSNIIKNVRIQINEKLPHNLTEWKKDSLAKIVKAELDQTRKLFPGLLLKLTNLTIPACTKVNYTDGTMECLEGPWDFKVQTNAFNEFFDGLSLLDDDSLNGLIGVELNAGVSEFEPEVSKRDLRHIIYNPGYEKLLLNALGRGSIFTDATRVINVPRTHANLDSKRACVYYNAVKSNEPPLVGEVHSLLMANLMGGFPNWSTKILAIDEYKKDDLEKCDVGFYIATNYFYEPHPFFLSDLSHFIQQKTFVWFNYKFDFFQKDYAEIAKNENLPQLEFDYKGIHKPQGVFSPSNLNMGFYRYFDYKGETFSKMATWNYNTDSFSADPEMGIVLINQEHPNTEVLVYARHSTENTKTPYVTKQNFKGIGNIYYFGDSPFSFIHYEDRYMILTDLMWDILHEEAPTEKLALVRLEDISGSSDANNMRWAIDYLADTDTPFSIALIPIYSSVFGTNLPNDLHPAWKPINKFPEMTGILKYAKSRGANFVFHGVAHQGGDNICGYDGNSADDFEFWMYPENTPMPDDSINFVTKLLDQGEEAFRAIGITPAAWETPHYSSSALDSIIFGRTFNWTYHRPIYFPIKDISYPKRDESLYYFNCKGADCKKKQLEYLNKISVSVDSKVFSGQIFPYPIYNDVYGQRIIPETLGFVDHLDYPEYTWRDISSHLDILRRAKKLRVIRGAIASFFWHPHMLSRNSTQRYLMDPRLFDISHEGKDFLRLIVEGIKDLGYTFISISDQKYFPSL